MSEVEFQKWPKIARWNKPAILTEKIDGTNACVIVTEDGAVHAQSRSRIITPDTDNFGFARWAQEHADELASGLGEGYHYGEWYGAGIQRRYGLDHKRFALFNSSRWTDERPTCCDVVPVLLICQMGDASDAVNGALHDLASNGSRMVPGFMRPEGLIIYSAASRVSFKVTLEGDGVPKSAARLGTA